MNWRLIFSERTARLLAVALAIGLPIAALSPRLPGLRGDRVEVHARMPEDGGWLPGDLQVEAGQPLHLRLISDDVLHGFAIGQQETPAIDLYPGKAVETTLTFAEPGKYTYYCTRWCGVNHWRMRGTIEVTGSGENSQTPPAEPLLYVTLGLDIDAPHPASVVPAGRPSAERGAQLGIDPFEFFGGQDWRALSPSEAFQILRAEPVLKDMDDGQIWDLVAFTRRASATPADLALGRDLYAQNCAACHGENGDGGGVMAEDLASGVSLTGGDGTGEHSQPVDGHSRVKPVDFTDPLTMLGASPAVLHGKIVRGGMGTGMPYWGPILTDEQIWALVTYLTTFSMDLN